MPPKKDQNVIKKKHNPLDLLKSITRWICFPNKRNRNYIEDYLDIYAEKNKSGKITGDAKRKQKGFLFLRVLSYCYNNPHLVWYFNKYFNNKFNFERYDRTDLIMNMFYLMDLNNHSNNRSLFFIKSNDLKDVNFHKVRNVIKEYFQTIYNRQLNNLELGFYYKLFLMREITTDDIIELDSKLNGGESKLDLVEPLNNQNSADNSNEVDKEQLKKWIEEQRVKPLPEKINEFINNIKQQKTNREKCKSCKLYEKPIVVLDTNMEDFGPVDVMFIALNPGKDEVIYNKPLVGKAGTLHRSKMYYLNPNTKWVMTNTMLCNTSNQKEIGKTDKEIMEVASHCTELLGQIIQAFPPKYIVAIGSISAKIFGLKGSIQSSSGDVIDIGHNINMIPMVHPSAVIQYHGNQEIAYNRAFDTIYELMDQQYGKTELSNKPNISNQNSTNVQSYDISDSMITHLTSDLTLFDVVELNGNEILMIFIDSNGKKKYLKQDYSIPVYIKNRPRNECTMINNEFDHVLYINGYNKKKIVEAVKDSLNIIKK